MEPKFQIGESPLYTQAQLDAAIEAARPKVSEDDEKAAEKLVEECAQTIRRTDKRLSITADLEFLAGRIASYAASVRLAERERIREAVDAMQPTRILNDSQRFVTAVLNDVLKMIDGQPVEGGRE